MIPTYSGDMGRFLATQRQTMTIKNDLHKLTHEMSSGQKADLPRALGVNQARVADIQQRISRIDVYSGNAAQLSGQYRTMEVSLDQISGATQALADRLLSSPDMMAGQQRAIAAETARHSFDTVVSALSASYGGISLFSGVNTDSAPLPDAATIMTSLRAAVDLSGTAAQIQSEVEAFFESDTGPLVSTLYQGGQPSGKTVSIGDDRFSKVEITATSGPIRQMLAGAALASLIGDPAVAAEPGKQKALIEGARDKMLQRGGLTTLQANLGTQQALLQQTQASMAAEKSSLSIEINDLTRADPYETASRLQQVQLQLETHYTITGRLSRLSLVNFLP